MDGEEPEPMMPWYKGWTGTIESIGNDRCSMLGSYEVVDSTTLKITELPVGKWTKDYKSFVEDTLMTGQDITVEDLKEFHAADRINFELTVPKLKEYERKG